MISQGNMQGANTETYLRTTNSGPLGINGSIFSNVKQNQKVDSITMRGHLVGTRGSETRAISQDYTVSVTSSGQIYMSGTGINAKLYDSLGAAVCGRKEITGKVLTFTYGFSVAYAHGQGAQITQVGATVLGNGGSVEWQSNTSTESLAGEHTIVFEAVE